MTILNEESRNNLIAKSKNSVKGLERYKKRVKSRVASSTQEFNQIDMNKLYHTNTYCKRAFSLCLLSLTPED